MTEEFNPDTITIDIGYMMDGKTRHITITQDDQCIDLYPISNWQLEKFSNAIRRLIGGVTREEHLTLHKSVEKVK